MTIVYVLELQHGCAYVGQTENMAARLEEHRAGGGSGWTTLHPPVGILQQRDVPKAQANGLETELTARLMLERGVQKVRGAGLSLSREYTRDDAQLVITTIGHALDLDYGDVEEMIAPQLGLGRREAVVARPIRAAPPRADACFRCGRTGHWANQCYARTAVGGHMLESEVEAWSDADDDGEWSDDE